MFGGDLPPAELEFRKKVQEGLPKPQNEGAALVLMKREALSTILSGAITPDQFMVSAVAAANELPAGTRRVSVVQAVFNAATLGLMFGAIRGEAYLVAYKDRDASKKSGVDVYDCNLIIGYKGFRNLAFQTGFLQSFTTEVVLEGEEFECFVDEGGRRLRHRLPLGRQVKKGGENVMAAYCQYTTRTGGTNVVVVQRDELNAAQPNYSDIWKFHYSSMAQKTAIRRAAKEWAVTGSINGAVVIDEQVEAGLVQSFLGDSGLLEDVAPVKPNPRQKTGISARQEELERIKAGASSNG
jgi:phage RecT family recombinase